MDNENLINSLDSGNIQSLKDSLDLLINRTFEVENEYKNLNHSYQSLKSFISNIVEIMPNALWVLQENGSIFLQNSEAHKLDHLLPKIDLITPAKEIQIDNFSYLTKVTKKDDKIIVTATDITGEKRKERLASMGQVAAHLSHEIRNPIGSISILASTLYNKVDIKAKPIVFEMKRSIWRVERIIKATLLFTKGVQVNPKTFYLDELDDEINNALGFYSFSKDIDFDINLSHTKINADKELLSVVLQNILFNAIDAIEESHKESGTVRLSYRKEDGFSYICVEDNGKEIEDETLLFEAFKTTKTKGNGLGLNLCMQIAKAHEGEIFVLKNPKRFCIKLKDKIC